MYVFQLPWLLGNFEVRIRKHPVEQGYPNRIRPLGKGRSILEKETKSPRAASRSKDNLLRMNRPSAIIPPNPDVLAVAGSGIFKPQTQLTRTIRKSGTDADGFHPAVDLVAQNDIMNLERACGLLRTNRPERDGDQGEDSETNQKKKKLPVPGHYTHRPRKKTSAEKKT